MGGTATDCFGTGSRFMDNNIMFLVRIAGMPDEPKGLRAASSRNSERCSGGDARESGSSAISTVVRDRWQNRPGICLCPFCGGFLLPSFCPVPKRGLHNHAPNALARLRRVQHKGWKACGACAVTAKLSQSPIFASGRPRKQIPCLAHPCNRAAPESNKE